MTERAVHSLVNPSLMTEREACSLMNPSRMKERVARSLVKLRRARERAGGSVVKLDTVMERAAGPFVRYGHRRAKPAHQRFGTTHFRTRSARAAAKIMPARPRDDARARFAMPDPIPRKDSDFLTWSGNLCDRANEFAAELNLPQELLDQLAPLRAAFVAAYHRAYSPARSRVDTRAKNDARKALERPLRQISGMTRFSATNAQRILMGLKPRRIGKAPLTPRPDTAPVVHITSIIGRTFHLHLASDTGRPRPDGVTCAAVYWFAGENPPPDLRRGWCMPRLAVRRKHTLEIPARVSPGTKVWVSAQWLSGSKLLGPSSPPIFQYVGWGMGRFAGLKAA